MPDEDIRRLLGEIRDGQREALDLAREQVALAREQFEHARTQIDQSMRLQREAVTRARHAARIAIPGIAICIGLIVYLIVRYL